MVKTFFPLIRLTVCKLVSELCSKFKFSPQETLGDRLLETKLSLYELLQRVRAGCNVGFKVILDITILLSGLSIGTA